MDSISGIAKIVNDIGLTCVLSYNDLLSITIHLETV